MNQINLWKKQLLRADPKVFSRGKDHEAERLNKGRDRLYHKVGQLQVEMEKNTRSSFFGTRKMRDLLKRKEYQVNRKRVQRFMRLMGLESIAPKKRTTIPGKDHKIYPYLLKNLDVKHPNQVWCSDITFIKLRGALCT